VADLDFVKSAPVTAFDQTTQRDLKVTLWRAEVSNFVVVAITSHYLGDCVKMSVAAFLRGETATEWEWTYSNEEDAVADLTEWSIDYVRLANEQEALLTASASRTERV